MKTLMLVIPVILVLSTFAYSEDLFKTTWKVKDHQHTNECVLIKARDLCHQEMYDESLEILNTLKLDTVCNPVEFLYYKACCEHFLLKKDECIKTLHLLLDNESELPIRYSTVAKLMLNDIELIKEDSLEEIERLMKDVERRLDFGRTGKIVRDQEKEIIDKLDKLIKETEQQAENAKQAQAKSEGKSQQQDSKPMEKSDIAGGSGAGDVDQKNTSGDMKSWGNLPPKERQEALQKLTRELPSHYRQAIEQYFRKLGQDDKK